MPSKFEFSQKEVKTKNNKKIKTTIIKASKADNLITYNDISKFVKKLQDNGVNTTKLKIFGMNRLRNGFTMKSENQDFDYDYLKNKARDVADKLDGFYEIHLINLV